VRAQRPDDDLGQRDAAAIFGLRLDRLQPFPGDALQLLPYRQECAAFADGER